MSGIEWVWLGAFCGVVACMTDGSRTQANMAGSVNSAGIEDVLSSIRRLVSEDMRPPVRPQGVELPAGPQHAEGPQPVAADKLILTPALRVLPTRTLTVVPRMPPAAAVEAKPMPRLHLGSEHGVTRATPDVVVTLGQGVDQTRRLDWESETGDPEPGVDGLDWSSFTFARRSTKDSLDAPGTAAEIAAAAPPVAADLAAHREQAAQSVPRSFVRFAAQHGADVPEAPMAEDVTCDPIDWADLAEAEALADLESMVDTVKAELEDMSGSPQEEDNIFSEQVLRELVRDLIREQLQGDLGERITRNIRKMVRAEISNALAVHKLD